MLTIYHRPRVRSIRVIWAAEELGIPYEVKIEDPRNLTPEFLELNPAKTFPVVTDGDLVLTESVAILMYMGEKHGPSPLIVPREAANYPLYLQYLIYGEGSLAAYLSPIVATKFFAPAGDKQSWTLDQCRRFYATRLKQIEARLDEAPYLAGEDFTLADISVGYALGFGQALHLSEHFGPRTAEYWSRIRARPAAQKAYAAAA